MNNAIERRWIGYDWFKLAVAIILALLLLVFRPIAAPVATTPQGGSAAPAATAAPAAAPAAVIPAINAPGAAAPDGKLTLTGTGAPGAEVEIIADGASVGKATIGADGAWSLPITLPAGEHEIVARALDAGAAVSSPVRVAVAAPAAAPTTAAVAPTVAAAPQPAAQAPAITAPASGASVEAGNLMLIGTGTPGATIEILDGNAVIGTTTAGADGAWSFEATAAAGAHAYTARVAGETSASAPIDVSVATPPNAAGGAPGAAPAITSPADGATLDAGPIALAGTGAPGATIEILDSDKVLGTTTVGADGTWSFEATPSGGTAALSARPAGATDVTDKPIRLTIGAGATATCDQLAINCDAWVTRQGGLSLRMRASAGTSAAIVERLPVGTQLTLLEGPQPAAGYSWWRARTLGGAEGWVAGEELRTAPD
jgi:hypothetical protein